MVYVYICKYTIHESFGTLSGEGESVIKSGASREGEVGSWTFSFGTRRVVMMSSRPMILEKDLPVIIPNESSWEPTSRGPIESTN